MEKKDNRSEHNSSSKESHKKNSKTRSREHRERKKAYISKLEQRIENLEQENGDLKEQIKVLKSLPLPPASVSSVSYITKGIKKFENPLFEHEDFMYNKMSHILIKNPEQARYSQLEQGWDHITDYSDERINYIKDLFKKILDNMVNLESKCTIACLKNNKPSEILRKARTPNKRDKYSAKSTQGDLKSIDIGDIFYKGPFSQGFINFLTKDGKKLLPIYKTISKLAKKLTCLRNELLNAYCDFKTIYEESKDHLNYNKQDIANLYKALQKIQEMKLLTNERVYGIPVKKHKRKKYSEGEMTE
ncbi:unnamed protein product [Moneuplotes crassus]|uniref:BZIP domain-containing protein n=1 Tax=Euplotes crassus TaxID=5936 RepID=A0AAD1XBX4_EUPCR|nr:unnamed protein product [Moneuplotes crassus]